MERMVQERLTWWLETSGILPEQMTGFRRGRCAMDCILDLVTYVETERAKHRVPVAVFLDTYTKSL